ncbi:class I SAM-dependent methyltransferase [Sciscionella sediminilitoris]|uniref:class I SAM-dependent methyltransferase n=1 Tax=Sciscionella sediminilitoris TaxID=1445613 RepID=UPI0004DF3D3C|nr:class I SAM-dependent methyltransferase [Sciscionella sp. SE31]
MYCRLCGSARLHGIVDLGATPPCERFLSAEMLEEPEPSYPLRLRLCADCLLAQIPALITPEETFTEYAYFSSYSDSWVAHAKLLVEEGLARSGAGFVVEVASNDGYLLRHVAERGVRCLGIEPSVNVGKAARDRGIPTLTAFLGPETARAVRREHGPAALVIANNVYAHVPDLLGFTAGLRELLAADGWLCLEVAYLARLIEGNQFDTIYHEHFQYYTLASAIAALRTGGLDVVDVETLDTHGGSLRIWARPAELQAPRAHAVGALLAAERAAGLHSPHGYRSFAEQVTRTRAEILRFLLDARAADRLVVGYGAPGKGNTLLNYCGVRPDLLPYTVDRNPYKHGRFTPGTRIPIHPPERIAEDRPDYVFVLPWNLRAELTEQLAYIGEWGGKLIFPIPELQEVRP